MITSTLASLFSNTPDLTQLLMWGGVGVLLLIFDMLFPGIFLLFLGVSSLITTLILWVVPLPLWGAIACFSVISLILMVCFARTYRTWINQGPAHTLNQRADSFKGQTLTLTTPLVNGRGRVSFKGSMWTVEGPDLPGGSHVIIIKMEGTVLHVEPLPTNNT